MEKTKEKDKVVEDEKRSLFGALFDRMSALEITYLGDTIKCWYHLKREYGLTAGVIVQEPKVEVPSADSK